MKTTGLVIVLMVFLLSCVRMPKNRFEEVNNVAYSFDGGADMLSLFHLKASYLDSNNQLTIEDITSLPWTKQVRFRTSAQPVLNVTFESRSDFPDKKSYNIGYWGDIKSAKQYEKQERVPANFSLTKSGNQPVMENLKFKFVFETKEQAENAELVVPPLKYDKHFALSYTVDDANVGAYSKLWRRINQKWIDDIDFFHKRTSPSSGYVPSNTLCYTDGCGNDIRFPIGVAIWPNAWNQYSPNGYIQDFTSSVYSPYITWEEISDVLDFGGSVYYHNIDETTYDVNNYNRILEGLKADRDKTIAKTGRFMKVMALPDGNKNYISAFEKDDNIVMVRAFSGEPRIRLKEISTLYKQAIQTGGNGMSDSQILGEIRSQAESSSPYWLSFTIHNPEISTIKLLEDVCQAYGKEGLDNMWFATFDEVYEYVSMRSGLTINKTVNGNTAEFEVVVPVGEKYYYKELSFLANSKNIKEVVPVSGNITGLFLKPKSEKSLINIRFDDRHIAMAEKYTLLYENTVDKGYKEDANYFLSLLSPELADSYKARIDKIYEYPVKLNKVIINNGDLEVYNKVVDVSFSIENKPTHYKIWEGDNENGAVWLDYTGTTCKYELSNSFGAKMISVKIKDERSVSPVYEITVDYKNFPEKGNLTKNGVLEYLKKYDGFIWNKQIELK